ncbi:MAG: PAS domain S-box protein [Candidatus Hodarchaeota archaeon]
MAKSTNFEVEERFRKLFVEQKKLKKKIQEFNERYALITENVNDFIGILDKDLNFEYINEVFHRKHLGYSKKNLVGSMSINLIHPEDIQRVLKYYKKAIRKGEGKIELRVRHKDGYYIWVEVKGKRFVDVNNKLKTLIISRDITERKEIERKLKESEEKYRLISETAYDLITVLNKKFKYEYINENAFMQVLGYSSVDIIGKSALKFVHPDDLSRTVKTLMEGFKQGRGEMEYRLKHIEGHWVWFEGKGKTFVDKDGELKAIIISRDINQRKLAEEKLRQSEERYRLISQNSDENLFIFDMNLNLIYNDTNVPNILGYTYEEMKDLSLMDYNVPSSLKIALNAYKEELRNERKKLKDPNRIRTFEVEQIHKDGSIVNVETKFTFLRDKDGKATGILGLSRNITKRKQAEQKLKESEEKYRLISETAYDLIGVLNKKFKHEYINETAFRQILGYSREDILGKSALKFIHPDDLSKITKALFEGFKQGEGEGELRFRHKEGHWVWIESKGKTYFDVDGEIKALVISRDITERKKAANALKESEEKYREAYNRAQFYKDLFVHDMSNILAVINSSAELIPYYCGESEQSKNIISITEIIRNQVERGAKLVSNVNILSELEEQQKPFEHIEINVLLENSIAFIRNSFKERNVKIQYKSNGEKLVVYANQLLREVFDNILINGIKYNENHSVEFIIEASVVKVEQNKFVKIEFMDNGIGIPDDRKEMIFKRGNRELKGTTGMGIGLSLVKKIIKGYNGKIWIEDKVENDYTKGSNFIVLIPQANQKLQTK